jgi:L-fuculose-phosphate aldolase
LKTGSRLLDNPEGRYLKGLYAFAKRNLGANSRETRRKLRRRRFNPACAGPARRQTEETSMTLFDKRAAIVAAARELNATGLNQGTAGNISLRDGEAMLITPSGVPCQNMQPASIARMSLSDRSGAFDGPLPPSSEWRFHFDILQARPDVNAIVHTHSPYATTLSILRRDIPAVHYMIAAFGGSQIRCTEYAPFGTAELSELAVAALGSNNGVLLGNHGAIATGADLAKAMWRAVELENLAKFYYLAQLAGAPVILSDEEIAVAIDKFKNYGLNSGA